MPKKSRLKIHGNDRGLMMLCRDARRRWLQYGENRKSAKTAILCEQCTKQDAKEFDHIDPLGPRPRTFMSFGPWLEKMFTGKCQALCKACHNSKTKRERKRRTSGEKN